MNDATFLMAMPPVDLRTSSALFSALFEQLLKMPQEKARPILASVMEQWMELPRVPRDGSWKSWFDFCESVPGPVARSYQEILEDEDRR